MIQWTTSNSLTNITTNLLFYDIIPNRSKDFVSQPTIEKINISKDKNTIMILARIIMDQNPFRAVSA